jgi:hypothetical protein
MIIIVHKITWILLITLQLNKTLTRKTARIRNRLNIRVFISLGSLSAYQLFPKLIVQFQFLFNQLYKQHLSPKTNGPQMLCVKP